MAESWLCIPCMQGEVVAKDNHKSEGTGKKVAFRATKYHPTMGPGLKGPIR